MSHFIYHALVASRKLLNRNKWSPGCYVLNDVFIGWLEQSCRNGCNLRVFGWLVTCFKHAELLILSSSFLEYEVETFFLNTALGGKKGSVALESYKQYAKKFFKLQQFCLWGDLWASYIEHQWPMAHRFPMQPTTDAIGLKGSAILIFLCKCKKSFLKLPV